jgi:transcriptional regulator with XRE-family HTH domain
VEKLTPKSLRLRAGLSQRQVSQLLDVTQQTVGSWEKGVIPRLTPSQAKLLCQAYQCSIEDLIQAFEG